MDSSGTSRTALYVPGLMFTYMCRTMPMVCVTVLDSNTWTVVEEKK